MTAIVYDGFALASDTALFGRDNTLVGTTHKIEEWSKGVFGTAGYVKDGILFKQWLEGELEEPPRLHKGFEALFTEGKEVFYCDRSLVPETAIPPIGIGSAANDCEVLVRVGYSAKEAIIKAFEWRTDINNEVEEFIL